MSEQSNNPRDPEDPMARISGAVSEDYQAVTTDQDPQMTAEATVSSAGPSSSSTSIVSSC